MTEILNNDLTIRDKATFAILQKMNKLSKI